MVPSTSAHVSPPTASSRSESRLAMEPISSPWAARGKLLDLPVYRLLGGPQKERIFCYCTGNDLTARDLQARTSQWMLGKSADNFGPIGPYLVTADQVPDPNELKLECRVNGEVRQSSNTADMVFDCKALVSYISRHFTLRPGDIIFTGTPEGVIAGYPKDKQVWLKPGDKVTSMIEKLGTQEITLG